MRYCVISTATNYVADVSASPTTPPYYYSVASDHGEVGDLYDPTNGSFYEWQGVGAPQDVGAAPTSWVVRLSGITAKAAHTSKA